MLSSAVIDVAIAVALTFALTALTASALVEWIGNLTKKRAKYLLRGLRNMLDAADNPGPAGTAAATTGSATAAADAAAGRAPAAEPAPAEPAPAALVDVGPDAPAPAAEPDASAAPGPVTGSPGPVAAPPIADHGVRSEQDLYELALKPTEKTIVDLRRSPAAVAGGLTALLFDHPLVRSMMQPKRAVQATRSRVPPYLSSEIFARALLDTLIPADGRPLDLPEVREAIEALPDAMPAKAALLALLNQTEAQARHTLDDFVASVEKWYDAQMDRVSGWYKRWAKRWIIVIAAVLCIGANIDAYAIARTLYADPVLRTAVVAEVQQGQVCGAGQRPEDRISCVRGLVSASEGHGLVLWQRSCLSHPSACVAAPGKPANAGDWLVKLLGLAVTIAAASMGAPFWFDALNRLVNLRNTGKVPTPKT